MKYLITCLIVMGVQIGVFAQYKVGDAAADFALPGTDGKSVSLADFSDAKGFIVVFTCNTCPYAQGYESRVVALDKKYKAQGFPVIAINPNDPAVSPKDDLAAMKQRSAEKGFTFPYLQDAGQKVYPQYGALKTPHIFVLNKEGGKNIVRYIGAIDNNPADANDVSERYVENAVDALLKGNKVAVEKTVAIGCSIKSK